MLSTYGWPFSNEPEDEFEDEDYDPLELEDEEPDVDVVEAVLESMRRQGQGNDIQNIL